MICSPLNSFFGFDLRSEASLSALTDEVVKSSANEGERLNPVEVRSSIARRLGLDVAGLPEPGREVEGVVAMMLEVHFQAPDAVRVGDQMDRFLEWFDSSPSTLDPVLKAGVARFWFVTIHPFDDGNGRMARAIADMALSQSDGTADRFFSTRQAPRPG